MSGVFWSREDSAYRRWTLKVSKRMAYMYYLMNKDNIVASLDVRPATEFSDSVSFEVFQSLEKLPIGFKDINSWVKIVKSGFTLSKISIRQLQS